MKSFSKRDDVYKIYKTFDWVKEKPLIHIPNSLSNKKEINSNANAFSHAVKPNSVLPKQRTDGYAIRYEDYAVKEPSESSTALEKNYLENFEEEKRRCKKCGKQYPITSEYFSHTPSGNHRSTCRKCMAKNTSKHSLENPDLVKERAKKRKEQMSESSRSKDYVSKELALFLYKSQKEQCFYCHKKVAIKDCDLDHKNPISKGGLDIKSNIVLACSFCNKEKHSKTLEEYRIWRKNHGYNILF